MGLIPGVLNGGALLEGPAADGSASQVIVTNGSGKLVFRPVTVDASGNLTASGDGSFGGMLGANGRLYTNQDLRIGSWIGNGFGPAVVNGNAVRLINNQTPSGDMALVFGSETAAYPKLHKYATAQGFTAYLH